MGKHRGSMESRRYLEKRGVGRERQEMIVDRLWALSVAPDGALEPRRWRRLLLAELRDLVEILLQRFAAEEVGGDLADAADARPDLEAQRALLRQQHQTVLAGLGGLEASLRARIQIAICQSRLRDVLTVLRAHAHGEDVLAEELLRWRESGARPLELQ